MVSAMVDLAQNLGGKLKVTGKRKKESKNRTADVSAHKHETETTNTDDFGSESPNTEFSPPNQYEEKKHEKIKGAERAVSNLDHEMRRTDPEKLQKMAPIHVLEDSTRDVVRITARARSRQPTMSTGSTDFLGSSAKSATRARTTYTTWDDNGAESAAKYVQGQNIQPVVIDVDDDAGYLAEVRDLLEKAQEEFNWDGHSSYFIPLTKLASIMHQGCVERLLKLADPVEGTRETEGFRQVFATLILINKHDSIMDFLDHKPRINDDALPNLHMARRSNGKIYGLALGSSRTNNTEVAFTTKWTLTEIRGFYDIQWKMRPLFFVVEGDKNDDIRHKKVHYICPLGTVLPFVYEPSPQSTWSSGARVTPVPEYEESGFSYVYFRKLHPDQQNLRRYTIDGAQRLVAVKRLKSSSLNEFNKELRMLIKLTPLATPHLSKLLATFEIPSGPGNPVQAGSYYCFMSEKADENLGTLRLQAPATFCSSQVDLARWIAGQCRGLAEGMKILHDYRYSELDSEPDDTRTATHGFHGNIKSDNILLYSGWEGQNDPLGLLQITDFGISSFHYTDSAVDIARHMDSHAYRPPESHIPCMRTSQSHDIWRLGCLFLEFLTWLVKGPESL